MSRAPSFAASQLAASHARAAELVDVCRARAALLERLLTCDEATAFVVLGAIGEAQGLASESFAVRTRESLEGAPCRS